MDRFIWFDNNLKVGEVILKEINGVSIYDGNIKSNYSSGKLLLTNNSIIWKDNKNNNVVLGLDLSYVIHCEEQTSLFKNPKVVVHLKPHNQNLQNGPINNSQFSFIMFSFKEGGHTDFLRLTIENIKRLLQQPQHVTENYVKPKGGGIGGIERKLQQKFADNDNTISLAFQDLQGLINMAKDMVTISHSISNKIKEKKGEISDDETIQFKSYLLSLGIDDPVTKDAYGNGLNYYRQLAKEIYKILQKPLSDVGVMPITDAYCRVNRARGLELLSPEDMINACKQFEFVKLPIKLETFDSGVIVIKSYNVNDKELVKEVYDLILANNSVSAHVLAKILGISVVLAKERLLLAEKWGHVCRDETVEGTLFFINYFTIERPMELL